MGKDTVKLIANNKKAWNDYFIEDKYQNNRFRDSEGGLGKWGRIR